MRCVWPAVMMKKKCCTFVSAAFFYYDDITQQLALVVRSQASNTISLNISRKPQQIPSDTADKLYVEMTRLSALPGNLFNLINKSTGVYQSTSAYNFLILT